MSFDPSLQYFHEFLVTVESAQVDSLLKVVFDFDLRHVNEHATFQSFQPLRQVCSFLELPTSVLLLLLVEMLRIVSTNDKRRVLDKLLGCDVELAFFDRLKFVLTQVLSTQDRVLTACGNTGTTSSLVVRSIRL